MPQVRCQFCGRPCEARRVEAGRPSYCSSGCALASLLPPGGVEGKFPVVPALIAALVVGFVYFNTVLFWTLALELAREGRPETAQKFARLATGLGVLVWLALAAGLWRAAKRRWTDAVVSLATLGLVALALRPELSPGQVVGADAVLALWVARGWGRQKFGVKTSLPV